MERMAGKRPWTVSVAVMPGEASCPALEALDLALRKDRDPDPAEWVVLRVEEAINRWTWCRGKLEEYGTPLWLEALRERCRGEIAGQIFSGGI